MIYILDNVLSSVEIQQIKNSLEYGKFEDGKATAGQYAQAVKKTYSGLALKKKTRP